MEEAKDLKKTLSVLKWMAGQARPFLFFIIVITVLGSGLSLIGVSIAVASKKMIDYASSGNLDKAVAAAGLFGTFIIVMIGMRAVLSILSTKITELLFNSIRQKLFQKTLLSQWLYSSKYHSEDILTRMTSDISALTGGMVGLIPSMISLGVGLVAAFTTLLIFDAKLAILAFIISPVSILFSRVFGRKLKHIYVKTQEAESASRSFIHETLQNIVVVKAFCLEDRSVKQVDSLQKEKLDWVVRRSHMVSGTSSMLSLGYWLGYFLAFGWGAFRLSSSAITFGTLVAFLQLVEQVQGPFVGLAYSLPQLISAFASAGRLMELEEMKQDKEVSIVPEWNSVGVKLAGVTFAYDCDKPVLKDVYANIKPGELVALVGPSGKGKTTIIRLLLSLAYPTNGHIYFNNGQGERLEACSTTRFLISYVPQGNTLFSGTIAENIRMGFPQANDNELEMAARAACAWEFIEMLPEGLNTVIGERGLGLSEGQAQRIAISRAIIRKAPILILDEATSALDATTEMKVLEAIKNLNSSRTCIIITHRTAALDICHKIFKLENGQIQEQCNKTTEVSDVLAV
jgi:ATP-binding cassette, subfamily B, bacterial